MIKRFNEFVNESAYADNDPDIIIELNLDANGQPSEPPIYNVNYAITIDGEPLEITGHVFNINGNNKFEPDSFLDQDSESYWDENWETISDQILDQVMIYL